MSCNLFWSSENKTMSSAKRRHGEGKLLHVLMGTEELMCYGKSLINKENSSGLKLHPCLTPLLVGKKLDRP